MVAKRGDFRVAVAPKIEKLIREYAEERGLARTEVARLAMIEFLERKGMLPIGRRGKSNASK